MDTEQKKIILDWFDGYRTAEEEVWHTPYFEFIERDLLSKTKTREYQDLFKCLQLTSQAVNLLLRKAQPTDGNLDLSRATEADILIKLKEITENREEPSDLKSAIHRAVRLAFRVSSVCPGEDRTAQVSPAWPDDKSVGEYIRSTFDAGRIGTSNELLSLIEPEDSEIAAVQARLTHRLTAVNIKKHTRIEITETKYLPWHLKFDATSDYTVLYVFKDMRWLLDALEMKYVGSEKNTGSLSLISHRDFLVPREIIQETIASLNYLYPRGGRETLKLLDQEGVNLHKFKQPFPDRPRLRDFRYYRARLVDVAYEFLNPPRRWRTIWKDRQNPMQFWTFRLSLLIFFFTLGFGVAATVLAVLQLDVARHTPKSE